MDFSKTEELICGHLYKSNRSNLDKIAAGNQEFRNRIDVEFNNFLRHVSGKMGKIYNYMVADERSEPKVITAKTPDFIFSFTIYPDKTSRVDITVLGKFGRDYDSSFMASKFRDRAGFVYFVESEYGFKIGCTYNLTGRIKHFGVKLPFKTSLHSYIESKHYQKLEETLHKLLSHKRLNGEWFKLDESDFNEIDQLIKNMNLTRKQNG